MTDRPTINPSSDAGKHWRTRYGPWALVTGASDGIGRAFAFALASRGINLVLVARRHVVLEQISRDLTKTYRVQTQVVSADLSSGSEVERVLSEVDGVDIGLLVASAGFGTSGRFTESNIETELNMVDVNVRSVLAMTKHFSQQLSTRGRGGIILLSSFFAFQGVPYSANYAATKAYIQTLAEGLRIELSPQGVDVLASAPGPTASGFAARAAMSKPPMMDTAEEVAERTLRALGRRTTVRPGRVAQMMGIGLALLPRSIRTRLLANIIGGLARPSAGRDEQTFQEQH